MSNITSSLVKLKIKKKKKEEEKLKKMKEKRQILIIWIAYHNSIVSNELHVLSIVY